MAKVWDAIAQLEAQVGEKCKRSNWCYNNHYHLIMQCGTVFTKTGASNIKGQPKNCYANCYIASVKDSSLIYCEGYAFNLYTELLVEHAWLLRGDEVIDPTWKDEAEYIGVALTNDYVRSQLLLNDGFGIIANDYANDFELLKNGFPQSALVTIAPKVC